MVHHPATIKALHKKLDDKRISNNQFATCDLPIKPVHLMTDEDDSIRGPYSLGHIVIDGDEIIATDARLIYRSKLSRSMSDEQVFIDAKSYGLAYRFAATSDTKTMQLKRTVNDYQIIITSYTGAINRFHLKRMREDIKFPDIDFLKDVNGKRNQMVACFDAMLLKRIVDTAIGIEIYSEEAVPVEIVINFQPDDPPQELSFAENATIEFNDGFETNVTVMPYTGFHGGICIGEVTLKDGEVVGDNEASDGQ